MSFGNGTRVLFFNTSDAKRCYTQYDGYDTSHCQHPCTTFHTQTRFVSGLKTKAEEMWVKIKFSPKVINFFSYWWAQVNILLAFVHSLVSPSHVSDWSDKWTRWRWPAQHLWSFLSVDFFQRWSNTNYLFSVLLFGRSCSQYIAIFHDKWHVINVWRRIKYISIDNWNWFHPGMTFNLFALFLGWRVFWALARNWSSSGNRNLCEICASCHSKSCGEIWESVVCLPEYGNKTEEFFNICNRLE